MRLISQKAFLILKAIVRLYYIDNTIHQQYLQEEFDAIQEKYDAISEARKEAKEAIWAAEVVEALAIKTATKVANIVEEATFKGIEIAAKQIANKNKLTRLAILLKGLARRLREFGVSIDV